MKKYYVTLQVVFTESHQVEAVDEETAIDVAKDMVCHGMGEDVSLYEAVEI